MYHYLACFLRLSFPKNDHSSKHNGVLCNTATSSDGRIRLIHVPSHGLTCPRDPKVLDVVRGLHAEKDETRRNGTLVVNPGTWDAGYGYIEGYEQRLMELKTELVDGGRDGAWRRAVFLSTTDVHPINYPGVHEDHGRQYLTGPRVR